MTHYSINNIKDFTAKLFCSEIFDSFYLSEATLVTFNTYHIDGYLKTAYFSDLKETESVPDREYSLWGENRSFCFDLIKGKRTPLQFKIVLILSRPNLQRLLESQNISYPADKISGLFFNISYQDGALSCITGTSLKEFSLDKTIENTWDSFMEKFLQKYDISYEK